MLRYSFYEDELAVHASDLIPTFMNSEKDAYNMLVANGVASWKATLYATLLDGGLSRWYQDYLSSFGVYGNPNTGKSIFADTWPLATQGEEVSNVMEVYGKDSSRLISDDQNTKTICDFWTGIAKKIESLNPPEERVYDEL